MKKKRWLAMDFLILGYMFKQGIGVCNARGGYKLSQPQYGRVMLRMTIYFIVQTRMLLRKKKDAIHNYLRTTDVK